MKKLLSLCKFSSTALMLTLLVLYAGAALRFWTLFKELELMQNLTASFDLYQNHRLKSRDNRWHPAKDDEFELAVVNELAYLQQNFSKNILFVKMPAIVACSSMKSEESRNSSRPTIVVIVKSRPYETFQRNAIRSTYGPLFDGKLIFVVGRDYSQEVEDALSLEYNLYKDILQADFDDTYYNLSYKSLAILQWITDHCSDEQFYIQADSDALLFPENLRLFAEKHKTVKRHIFGLCWKQAPVRRSGKWRVPETRYSFVRYPDYCSGAAFVMTGDVPALLLKNVNRSSSYMSVDDAYFSGVLAEKAGVNRVRFPGFSFQEGVEADLGRCPCQKLLATFEYKTADELTDAWNKFRTAQASCL